jgi:hypothetical protein
VRDNISTAGDDSNICARTSKKGNFRKFEQEMRGNLQMETRYKNARCTFSNCIKTLKE